MNHVLGNLLFQVCFFPKVAWPCSFYSIGHGQNGLCKTTCLFRTHPPVRQHGTSTKRTTWLQIRPSSLCHKYSILKAFLVSDVWAFFVALPPFRESIQKSLPHMCHCRLLVVMIMLDLYKGLNPLPGRSRPPEQCDGTHTGFSVFLSLLSRSGCLCHERT